MQFKATLIALAITFIGVNAAPQLGLPGLSSLGGLTGGVTNGAEGGATSGGATSVINEVISVLGGATGGDIGNPNNETVSSNSPVLNGGLPIPV